MRKAYVALRNDKNSLLGRLDKRASRGNRRLPRDGGTVSYFSNIILRTWTNDPLCKR